jgi:hypothetical protein
MESAFQSRAFLGAFPSFLDAGNWFGRVSGVSRGLKHIARSPVSLGRENIMLGLAVGELRRPELKGLEGAPAIGNGAAFHKGREFAAWLGRVPGQWSTGGKTKRLGISKRGNPYLRKMFIHGARAVVLRAKREGSYLGRWMKSFEGRAARNVVIVATANKLARISWAVLSSAENDHPMPAVAVAS